MREEDPYERDEHDSETSDTGKLTIVAQVDGNKPKYNNVSVRLGVDLSLSTPFSDGIVAKEEELDFAGMDEVD